VVRIPRYLAVIINFVEFGIALDLPVVFIHILQFTHIIYIFLYRVETFKIEHIQLAFFAEVIIAVVVAPEPVEWVFNQCISIQQDRLLTIVALDPAIALVERLHIRLEHDVSTWTFDVFTGHSGVNLN